MAKKKETPVKEATEEKDLTQPEPPEKVDEVEEKAPESKPEKVRFKVGGQVMEGIQRADGQVCSDGVTYNSVELL